MSEENKQAESKGLADIFYDIIHQTRNPFWFYFVISWVVWNYDIVYFIFFQDAEIFANANWWMTKYEFIKNTYFLMDWQYFLWEMIKKSMYPFLVTLIITLILPTFNIWVKSILILYKKVEESALKNYPQTSEYWFNVIGKIWSFLLYISILSGVFYIAYKIIEDKTVLVIFFLISSLIIALTLSKLKNKFDK